MTEFAPKPRRGRPPKIEAPENAPEMAENATSTPKKRRRRAKIGEFAMKLKAPPRPGYTRRWVNDAANRIAECDELAYDFVDEKGIKTDDPSSRVARIVGTKPNGEPLKAYLMETPDELYAEGVAEKEALNAQVDENIRRGRDTTGRMDEQTYSPSTPSSIKIER